MTNPYIEKLGAVGLPQWLSEIGFKNAIGSFLRDGYTQAQARAQAWLWVRRMDRMRAERCRDKGRCPD